jgi:urease accessory protein
MTTTLRFSIVLAAGLAAGPARAHTGATAAFSLESGFLHPFLGVDHLLAMLAVGLFAAQLGGRAVWQVPLAFVAAMGLGAAAAGAGWVLPGVELGVAWSVVAIAAPVVFALGMPKAAAMALVAVFAAFHGQAHAAELPVGAAMAPYALGFLSATALIHAAGLAAGLYFGGALAPRFAAGLIAAAGLAFVV